MARSGKPFPQKMALGMLIMVLVHIPLSNTLRTRSALPKISSSRYNLGDWYLDNFWHHFHRKDSHPGKRGDEFLNVLKRIVSYKPLINEQLVHDVNKLSKDLGMFLFRHQGIPKVGSHGRGIFQPVDFHPRFHGINHFSKDPRVQHLAIGHHGQKFPHPDRYFVSPHPVPVGNPVTVFAVNPQDLLSKTSKLSHHSEEYSMNPEEETISKAIDQLTGKTRYPDVTSIMNLITEDEFGQPLKPVTYTVPSLGSRGPHLAYPSGQFSFLNKPTMKPSRGDLLKLENRLKQFLFSPESFLGKLNPETIPAKTFPQTFNELEAADKAAESILTKHTTDVAAHAILDSRHGDPFGKEDEHFQSDEDLGYGQASRDEPGREEEDEEEEEQGTKGEGNLQPVSSSSFSMSFGSFDQENKDCDSILTKACADDSECLCYGFYYCQNSRCREHAPSASSYDMDDASWGGHWHDGPAETLGRH